MSKSGESPKVEEISKVDAAEILQDEDFLSEHKLSRVYSAIRDPKNPSVILGMTVMESG